MKKIRKLAAILKREGVEGFFRFLLHIAILDAIRLLVLPIRYKSDRDPTKFCFEAFLAMAHAMERPRVLELGSRNISKRSLFRKDVDHVGFDINPGPFVDIVGDIHSLSSHFPPASFDVVYCISVFEHLANPWKAVLEINKVLKPGGILFVFTHPTFPEHASPWDFWRYSRSAFSALLNAESGFAILRCETGLPCVILPLEDSEATRHAQRILSFMGIATLARKEGPARASIDWKFDSAEVVRAGYPSVYSDEMAPPFFRYLSAYRSPDRGGEPAGENPVSGP